jgi:hypothetical protein
MNNCMGGARYELGHCSGDGDGDGDGDGCTDVPRNLITAFEHDSAASVESAGVASWPLEWQSWQDIQTPNTVFEAGRSKAGGPDSIDCASPANDFAAFFHSTLNLNVQKLSRRGSILAVRCVANYPGAGDDVYAIGLDDRWEFTIGNSVPSPMDWGGRVNGLGNYLGIDERSGGNTYGSNGYATDAVVAEASSVDTITWEGEADNTTTLDILVNNSVAQNIALTGAAGELELSVSVGDDDTLAVRYAAGPVPVNMTVTLWLRKNEEKSMSLKALIEPYTNVVGATGAPTVRWQARRLSGDGGTISITGCRHDVVQAMPVYTVESIDNCEASVSCLAASSANVTDNFGAVTPITLGTGAGSFVTWTAPDIGNVWALRVEMAGTFDPADYTVEILYNGAPVSPGVAPLFASYAGEPIGPPGVQDTWLLSVTVPPGSGDTVALRVTETANPSCVFEQNFGLVFIA